LTDRVSLEVFEWDTIEFPQPMRILFAVRQIDAMALGRKNQMLGHFDMVFVTDEAVFMTDETNEQRERDRSDDGFFDVRTF
jgi:hypothetical protein